MRRLPQWGEGKLVTTGKKKLIQFHHPSADSHGYGRKTAYGGYAAAGGGGGGRSRHGKLFDKYGQNGGENDVCVPPFLDPSSHSLDFI